MRKELHGLEGHGVADLVQSTSDPPGGSIIGTRWVLRVKPNERSKARLAVQDWAQ